MYPVQVESILRRAEQAARTDPRVEYDLAVVRRSDDDLIGYGRLAIEPHRSAQVGFALRADQWGHGLGSETVQLLLTLGFDHLGLHRIWGARSPVNAASERVMLRLGMVEEGRIRPRPRPRRLAGLHHPRHPRGRMAGLGRACALTG